MSADRTFEVPADLAGQTLAAAIRHADPALSWAQVRKLILARRVQVNGTLCLDDARRLRAGETIVVRQQSAAPVPRRQDVRVVHADADILVVDKPAGVQTLRRHEEAGWSAERKQRQPTLDELLQEMLPRLLKRASVGPGRAAGARPKIRDVHRLDRDTSGLMLFAISPKAQQTLIRQFAAHEVQRVYLGVAHGQVKQRTIESYIIRDRGDGIRGSSPVGEADPNADRAVTHVRPIRTIAGRYTLVECRLETGRTHQIRIHLAEIGHMLCGEKIYTRPSPQAPPVTDDSGAPRQALHSAQLEFRHPITGKPMHFSSPLPPDLANWLERLEGR